MKRNKLFVSALACLILAALAMPAVAQKQLTHIRVSLGDVSLNKLIFVIAQEEGIYKKNGLDIEEYITPRAANVVKHSGVHIPPEYVKQFDEEPPIAIGGGSPFMVHMTTSARGVARVIVASTDNTVRWHIIAQPEIKRLEDLKGKRIGYSVYGSMTHFMALSFVLRMGWDPNQDVSLMSDALAVDTMKERKVDAFIGDEVARTMAAFNGFTPLQDLREWNLPIAGSGINVEVNYLKTHRDAVRRFVKSAVEALAIMKQNRDAGKLGIGKWYNIKDAEQQKMILDYASGLPRKPYPAVEGIKRVMEIYNYHEMRKHKPEDFYDDSFIKELDKSGYIDSLYK